MLSQFDDEETAAYFERLNAPLRKMPQADRAELHAELRQHLDALAAAHEELGASPDEAAHAALKQFGDPVKIGRRLFDEWRRAPQTNIWRIAGGAFWRLYAIQMGLSIFATAINRLTLGIDFRFLAPIAVTLLESLLFLVPVSVGIWAGKRFGRRAVPGLACMSASVFLLSPILSPLCMLFYSLFFSVPPPLNHFHLDWQAYWHQSFRFHFSLLASAWLAQRVNFPSQLSIAGVKSRFRR